MGIFDKLGKTSTIPDASMALKGRSQPIPTAETHFVNRRPLAGPYPEGIETAIFGLGCFWGAERVFWQLDGVYVTAVGYAGGHTPNPTYQEVCTGKTGHNEVVLIAYDPKILTYSALLKVFFEAHDPTQGMRQGNDIGTQYRSGIYVANEVEQRSATTAKAMYDEALSAGRYGPVTTEILDQPNFYFAEDYHQQYLAKNPLGYCGLGGTGIACPIAANAPTG